MNIFDVGIISIGIYTLTLGGLIIIVSFLGNIYQLIRSRKEFRQKIDNANKEIEDILKRNIYNGYIPQINLVNDIVDVTAKKYRLKRIKLYDDNSFLKSIKKDIMDNPVLPKNKIKKLISLIEKEESPSKMEKLIEMAEKESKKQGLQKMKEIEIIEQELEIVHKKVDIFSDDLEEFVGWNNYLNGKVSQSSEFSHNGRFSLKKDHFGDPHGGWKSIGRSIGFEEISKIIFSAWIYRPLVAAKALGDRLAIEDSNFCGYGFCVNHLQNTVLIERRNNGRFSLISIPISYNPPKNKWYHFEFCMMREGKFSLSIFDDIGGIEVNLDSFIDNKYLFFNRIAVHGGFPFYVDDLKVEIVG